MERLTLDTKILFCDIAQCRETPGGSFCENGYCDQRRVYERLREYERKGLAPEEIMVKDDILMCAAIVLGTSIDHIRDLLAAEKEGRVAVLPCKVEDTVWRIKAAFSYYSEPKEEVVDRFSFSDDGVNVICMSGYKFRVENFGRTVFLTRAEAEAALKGESDGDS